MASNLLLDEKLVAAINRRRIAEEQRKPRIFNPKQRLIGIDVDALTEQVHDTKLRKEDEERKDLRFHEELRRCDRTALMLQKKQEEEVRALQEEIDRFRLTEQRPEDRREYDLNDPNRKKKELPPRASDDDPRCSISGLQKLDGEDINYKERTKAQQKQNREWLLDQMLSKRMELNRQNNELQKLEHKLHSLDKYAFELSLQKEDCRRKVAEANSDFNQNLARQQLEQKRQQEISDDLDKLQDIYNAFYGDFLNENPLAARSSLGFNRIVADRWKGMTKDQLQEIYSDQRRQIDENKRKKEIGDQEKLEWDKLQLLQARQALLLERSDERKKQQIERERLAENRELAHDQVGQKNYLDKQVYTNVPSEEYFTQFSTTTR